MPSALEIEIAKKYKKMTGKDPVGLIDVLRILTGPDLKDLLAAYLNEQASKDPHAEPWRQ